MKWCHLSKRQQMLFAMQRGMDLDEDAIALAGTFNNLPAKLLATLFDKEHYHVHIKVRTDDGGAGSGGGVSGGVGGDT